MAIAVPSPHELNVFESPLTCCPLTCFYCYVLVVVSLYSLDSMLLSNQLPLQYSIQLDVTDNNHL